MNLKIISTATVLLGLSVGAVYAVLNNKTIPNIFNKFGKKNDVKVDDVKNEVKVDEVKNEVKVDEVKNEVKVDDVKVDDVKVDEVKVDEVKNVVKDE
jgi:hypothetical protein